MCLQPNSRGAMWPYFLKLQFKILLFRAWMAFICNLGCARYCIILLRCPNTAHRLMGRVGDLLNHFEKKVIFVKDLTQIIITISAILTDVTDALLGPEIIGAAALGCSKN